MNDTGWLQLLNTSSVKSRSGRHFVGGSFGGTDMAKDFEACVEADEAQRWDAVHLHFALEGAGVALWAWNVDTGELTLDRAACEMWGVPVAKKVAFQELSARIHPSDRERVGSAFQKLRGMHGHCQFDFRVNVGSEIRWISAQGKGGDHNLVDHRLFGLFLDVTKRKQAEEGNELLAGEMSHRVKNLLAIASGLTSITSRSSETPADMARQLTNRLKALGHAHDLVRPAGGGKQPALLGDLLSVLIAPYDDDMCSTHVQISVPRIVVGERAATALALVVHELATNALKYGALSSGSGTLEISGTALQDTVILIWTERGGPPVTDPSGAGGYGSKLINRTMSLELNGSVSCDWRKSGVVVTLTISRQNLAN